MLILSYVTDHTDYHTPRQPESTLACADDGNDSLDLDLKAWTNGRLHPVRHRVMNKGYEDRYSCGIFSFPIPNLLIEGPQELVDENHPKLFKPFDTYAYYKIYYFHRANQEEYGLKEFAGI
ncbi:hypothetical protein AMTR_s02838p00004170 [Amborella trichopoda]|uniref:Isopenicillin N synthase-like Fe(2+) 2OG dioxygenase domain-containing protein n=1 Tax=Amborella trichopoda TaxID=13333 RepID=U5D113_AMBTC|nr:hypothetical protein AMTR_s02838p00004170 [Amborella trichopoda]